MFEKTIRKAANTAGKVIKQEVAKGASTHIALALKIASVAAMVLVALHEGKKHDEPERQNESTVIPNSVTYNFYNADGEEVLKLFKF